MSTISYIGNFAVSHGLVIFIVSLILFLGRSLDKFVKKGSRTSFARDFLRAQRLNYLNAARISLDGIDNAFKTKKLAGVVIPKLTRLYAVSVLLSSTIMAYYLLISMNNYVFGDVGIEHRGIIRSALIFRTEESFEFIFFLLIPLLIFISNPILDFFSYSQTRIFLNKLIGVLEEGKYHPLIVMTFFCVLDLFYSFILFVGFIYTTRRFFNNYMFSESDNQPQGKVNLIETLEFAVKEPFELIGSYFSSLGVDGIYGGILLSTFISTLFVWYVYFSYFIGVIQKYFSKTFRYLNKHTYILRIFYRKPFSMVSYFISLILISFDILIKQIV